MTASSGAANFRNVLCEQVSKTVTSAHATPGDALTFTFSDGARIVLSLKERDSTGPEAVVIQGMGSRWTVL